MPSADARDPWLDFLRAAAIVAVMVHHVGQEWPVTPAWLHAYTAIGAKGVDLFFVLSGWLIGGLFWRERKGRGSVNLPRFWARRWLRTIPPYLGGLVLAWTAVWLYRAEPFDAGYLLFVQNYYEVMPFFFVSWSLCVEEHFYLLVPLLVYFVRYRPSWFLVSLALLPIVFRMVESPVESTGFGYAITATHLRADGLLLGFATSYASVYHAHWLERRRPVFVLGGVLAVGCLALDLVPRVESVLEPLLVAVVFLGALIAFAQHAIGEWFRNPAVGWVARVSYSIYLTHALVIHTFVLAIYPMLPKNELAALVVLVILVLLVGWLFHFVFERSAFVMRERVVPVKRW